MENMLCHFGLVHMFMGGFFGLLGVVGALLPDVLGLVGWSRVMIWKIMGYSHDVTWWEAMPEWAKRSYNYMHTVWAVGLMFFLESGVNTLRSLFGVAQLEIIDATPYIMLGYATHVLSDWFTHRQDVGSIIGVQTGVMVGVNWYESKYYWTEITAVVLMTIAVLICQWPNYFTEIFI